VPDQPSSAVAYAASMGAERGQSRCYRARVASTIGKPRSKNQLSAAARVDS
jgi:hypothetical protein